MKKTVSFTQDKSDSEHYTQECEWCEVGGARVTVSFTQDKLFKSDSDHYIQECEWCEEVHWSGLHCTLVWCTSDSEFYTRHTIQE